jgi:TrwC relaxase
VAGKLNLSKGYAPDYPWKNQGQAGADYYAGAAEHGEAPGQWWGKGAEALGLATGSIVDRKPYDLVYKDRVDPRDGCRSLAGLR